MSEFRLDEWYFQKLLSSTSAKAQHATDMLYLFSRFCQAYFTNTSSLLRINFSNSKTPPPIHSEKDGLKLPFQATALHCIHLWHLQVKHMRMLLVLLIWLGNLTVNHYWDKALNTLLTSPCRKGTTKSEMLGVEAQQGNKKLYRLLLSLLAQLFNKIN